MRRHRTLGKVMVMYIKAPTSGCEPASGPGRRARRPNGASRWHSRRPSHAASGWR
jgi:hypothetical protein